MKKLKIESGEVRQVLDAAGKVAARSSPVPYYSAVHFCGDSIMALDGDVLMKASMPKMGITGCVAAEPFLGLVKSIDKGEAGIVDGEMVLTSGKSGRWTMSLIDYKPDPVDTSEGEFKVPLTEDLMYLIGQADRVVDSLQRATLNGVIFWVQDGACRAMVTNGQIMSFMDLPEARLPETENGILMRQPMVSRIAQLAEVGDVLSLSVDKEPKGTSYRWVCKTGVCDLMSIGADSVSAERLANVSDVSEVEDKFLASDSRLRAVVARAIHYAGHVDNQGLVHIKSEKQGLALRPDKGGDVGEVIKTDLVWTNDMTLMNPDYLNWVVGQSEKIGKFHMMDKGTKSPMVVVMGVRGSVSLVALMCRD